MQSLTEDKVLNDANQKEHFHKKISVEPMLKCCVAPIATIAIFDLINNITNVFRYGEKKNIKLHFSGMSWERK